MLVLHLYWETDVYPFLPTCSGMELLKKRSRIMTMGRVTQLHLVHANARAVRPTLNAGVDASGPGLALRRLCYHDDDDL